MAEEPIGPSLPVPRKVLLLNLVFPPDGVSTAQILGEIALDFQSAGFEVVALTSMPHYNRDSEAERKQPISSGLLGIVGRSDFYGIPVHHVWVPGKSSRGPVRIMQWLWFHVAATIVGLRISPRPDVIFATSPPLTIGVNAWLLGRRGSVPHVFNVWELYPDIAIRLGYLSNSALIRILRRIERWSYRQAAVVTVTSSEMLKIIAGEGRAPEAKLEIVPNFVDLDTFRPGRKVNAFSELHGLTSKFVVSYAGNMSTPQGLGRLLDVAEATRENQGIHFLLVGGGLDQPRLAAESARRRLSNTTVLAHQPYSEVPDIYASSDLCVVPLSSGLTAEALPSKVFKIMASGRPILALTDSGSALARLVTDSACGVVVASDSASEIREVVVSLAADPGRLREMGMAGRRYAQTHFSRRVVSGRYIGILERALYGEEYGGDGA